MEAGSLEVRATVSLARFLVSHGRTHEARDALVLAARHGKPPTADQRDADALLTELDVNPS